MEGGEGSEAKTWREGKRSGSGRAERGGIGAQEEERVKKMKKKRDVERMMYIVVFEG